jgi:hypothetical protein
VDSKHDKPRIEINEQFRRALDVLEKSDRSVFITGRDGDRAIVAELADGEEVEITPFTWEIFRFYVEEGGLSRRSSASSPSTR